MNKENLVITQACMRIFLVYLHIYIPTHTYISVAIKGVHQSRHTYIHTYIHTYMDIIPTHTHTLV